MEINEDPECPVCGKQFSANIIERHVNKCLFLNTSDGPKRKRSPSPLLNKSSINTSIDSSVSPNKKLKNSNKINASTDQSCSKQNESSTSKADTESDTSCDNLSLFTDLLQQDSSDKTENHKHTKSNSKEIHPFFSSNFLSQTGQTKKTATKSETSTSKYKTNKFVEALEQEQSIEETKDAEKGMSFITPLAKQLQPKSLDDFVGQDHVFGENSMLRTLLSKGEITNMILWGPPGCGKTSLAGVIQDICKKESKRLRYVSLCAANAGVKDVQTIITVAKNELRYGRQTILFMDEIHRFNKRQQDTFLIHVEKGEIVLIGATTENPSFSINNALLSRCRVIVFEKLQTDALLAILLKAVNNFNIGLIEDDNPLTYDCDQNPTKLSIEKSALSWLADTSDGDARIALSNLQLVLQHNINNITILTVEDIKEEVKKSHLMYDRKGEEHYNLISALHKSIRASDANASLYWLTRMTLSGEDPLYIARRLVRAASEDIGNSDPNALQLAISTMQGCQLLGMPECDVLLAQCAIYLARAPKSREADTALAVAKEFIKNFEGPQPNVPMHLRNAPTKLMKDLGYGKLEADSSYICMPKGCEDVNFF